MSSSSSSDTKDSTNLDESKKAILLGILKQIKMGSEIKHIRLPSFVLQPRSILEAMTDFFAHQSIILNNSLIANPEERFFNVLKFYIAGFQARPTGVKKPFNPIIGEQNTCSWNFPDNSVSHFEAEQISHHPPHTAFSMYNETKQVYVSCNIIPSYVKFLGNSAETQLKGTMVLSTQGPNGVEIYEMTFPSLLVSGILLGKLRMQTVGKTSVICKQTGYSANLEFKSKSLFSSSNTNGVEAKIHKDNTHIFSLKGEWDQEVFMNPAHHKSKHSGSLFFDASKAPNDNIYKVEVPFELRPELDSQKVWQSVANGINARNDQETYAAKSAIEERQRVEEEARAKSGTVWKPSKFIATNYPMTNEPGKAFYILERLSTTAPFALPSLLSQPASS